jgi:hypothetical protein
MMALCSSLALRSSLCFLLLLLAAVAWPACAQNAPSTATVSFTLDFPQSVPDHYALKVAADGHAEYISTGKLTPDSEPADPFHLEFTISPATREKIFDLAAKAKYFEGKVDSGKRNIAMTGKKVLAFHDGQRNTQAEYNYSPNPAVQELTSIFQNISTTLEFGRRLDYFHHYQKLALEAELKTMEEMVRGKNLAEVQAVSPILEQIATDQSVINISRSRAQRLLAIGGTPASH